MAQFIEQVFDRQWLRVGNLAAISCGKTRRALVDDLAGVWMVVCRMTDHGMGGITIREFFRALTADEDGTQARKAYCSVIAEVIEDFSSWLAVDAFFGAGDSSGDVHAKQTTNPERRHGFIAAGLVAQMSSELIRRSVTLLGEGNEYGCSGLIRQLIECEYLFRAFQLDFGDATKWLDGAPTVKYDFSPGKLRKIGGFDAEEYSHHCEAGGHPRVGGRYLLDLQRQMAALGSRSERQQDEINAMLWMDLALHSQRAWTALIALIEQEHARFHSASRVTKAVDRAQDAHAEWHDRDALARTIGPLLTLIAADPDALMSKLVQEA